MLKIISIIIDRRLVVDSRHCLNIDVLLNVCFGCLIIYTLEFLTLLFIAGCGAGGVDKGDQCLPTNNLNIPEDSIRINTNITDSKSNPDKTHSNCIIRGKVIDKTGKPVRNRIVIAFQGEGINKRLTKTHDDGVFVINNLPPGEYHVKVSDSPNIRQIDGDDKLVVIDQDHEGEVLFINYDMVRIYGNVFNDNGDQINKVFGLILYDIQRSRTIQSKWANEEGCSYTVEGLQPGPHVWLLMDFNMRPVEPCHGLGIIAIPEQLDFKWDIHLCSPIFGRIVNKSGEGICGVDIGLKVSLNMLKREDNRMTVKVITDQTGHFALPGISDGNYFIWVFKDGYSPSSSVLEVNPITRKDKILIVLK